MFWNSSKNSNSIIIINDLVDLTVDFLNCELKNDITMYDKKSTHYKKLTDMLIEINLKRSPEFSKELQWATSDVFLAED